MVSDHSQATTSAGCRSFNIYVQKTQFFQLVRSSEPPVATGVSSLTQIFAVSMNPVRGAILYRRAAEAGSMTSSRM